MLWSCLSGLVIATIVLKVEAYGKGLHLLEILVLLSTRLLST